MNYYVTKMKSFVNDQTVSEESVTGIAVKEDRHQKIMSNIALKNGVEEQWTIERVAKFIHLHPKGSSRTQ